MKYDAVILGGGPGGCETALWISRLGGKAVVVEKGEVGGVCTNCGCIPTKALAAACDVLESGRRGGEFGIVQSEPRIDWGAIFKRRDRISMTMRKGVEKRLSDAKVELVRGEAKISSATSVALGDRILEGRALVIASGSAPVGLPGMELDHNFIISGDDAARSVKLPRKVVIIGGGSIGCEYASIYSRLGSDVTIVEALSRLLPTEDPEISQTLEKGLSKNVKVLTGTPVKSVDKAAKTVTAGGESISADTVLLAIGRRPVLPDGFEKLNVAVDKFGIMVDTTMRTTIEGVYAAGDVVSGLKLAHVAYSGARAAASNIMGEKFEANFSAVPWCIFTSPEIARVGKTEDEAKIPVRVGRADYLSNGKARCMGEREGFCKVVVDDASDVIIGVHMIGAHASDLIGEAALAVGRSMTASEVANNIHPHPTLSELLQEACRQSA